MSLLQATARHTAGLLGRESTLIRRLRPAYEDLLAWFGNGKGIEWTINGKVYCIDPHYRTRLGQHYDGTVADFLSERVREGAVCIDVGANVGVYVLQFARWSGPTGKVIAFEPNPSAREVLQRHVRMNGIEKSVAVIPSAVSSIAGEEILYAAESDGMSRLGAPHERLEDQVTEIRVPVCTLDNYCETNNVDPDWLLIDIEGFEIAALSGARNLIQRRANELGIVVEMHPNVWDSANTSRAQAERLFSELKLEPVPLTGQSDPFSEHGIVYLSQK